MRLLHIIAGGRVGGAERFFDDLVAALAVRGVNQHAVTRDYADRRAHLEAHGCAVTLARLGGPLDLVSGAKARRAAKTCAPDAVLAWMSRGARFAPTGNWPVVGRLGGYYDLKYFRRCDHLICNTPGLVRHCTDSGWPADRVTYIPNFSPVSSDAPVQRETLDTPTGATVLLVLARLVHSKGIDIAIEALRRLPSSVHLWIAGDGPEGQVLRAQAASQGVAERVKFLGWRQDRDALIKSADVCLVCSREEPFGNVIVNAWTNKKPVVAAASSGPAFLIQDRENGVLVEPDSADALAEAISALIDDPDSAQTLAQSGYEKSRGEFSEDAVVASYLALIERMAAD